MFSSIIYLKQHVHTWIKNISLLKCSPSLASSVRPHLFAGGGTRLEVDGCRVVVAANVTQGHEISKRNWRNGVDRLAAFRAATNNQFVKNTKSAKCSKVKGNKMKYACINVLVLFSFSGTRVVFKAGEPLCKVHYCVPILLYIWK